MSTTEAVGGVPEWTIADRLRKARETAHLSQAELAQAIGISRRSVTNYEAGTTLPRRPVLLSWAMVTGVRREWLAYGVIPDSPSPDGGPEQGELPTICETVAIGSHRARRAA